MFRFIAGRLFKSVIILFAILVLNFFLIHAAPGDPAAIMAGEAGAADEKFLTDLREQFGLDKPLMVQLGTYVWGAMHLDLGFSYRQQMPVSELIWSRLPATLLLTLSAFSLSIVLGVLAGVKASARQGTWVDTIISTVALLFYATPLFWVALMASLLFSVGLGWLPGFGYETIGAGYTGLRRALDIGTHLILPASTLGLFFTAVYMRMTRASMLEVSRLDFVKTARAKGLAMKLIQRRHILRNALLPVITLAGLQAGQVVGGAVLTETVFAWPGIGRLMFEAINQRDYNVILGVFFVCAAMVLLFNLITDILYGLVDPRISVIS
ncbi:ABC transporter permease [Granulosicoccus antarcticus]|uniref:Dipeptide transport system permease protein DppB n=1 Tax=Granulosicoccus antarcticus IMCC3135 TaxID=1192854 RepID=A0A2Z2NZA6_9GAMM|nr:ABC transporter permease [Granulosicoccus antarcticus]ASJ74210.1 Dipeptide transport system permease protein DppB [Granulosicoccus antarcticus IMCC3135]